MAGDVVDLPADAIEDAVGVLGRAFAHDPMYGAYFPDPARRTAGIDALNRAVLRMAHGHGEVRVAGGGRGVAVWMRPGAPVAPWPMLRAGVLGVPKAAGWATFLRFVGMDAGVEALRRRHVPGPCRHLLILAVEPDSQRSGLGSALIADGRARAEREGSPIWLETSVEANVGYYRRHGFDVTGEGTLGRSGTRYWGMLHPGSGHGADPPIGGARRDAGAV